MKKLWVWVSFLIIINVVWLIIDKTPPAWDQAAHLRSILIASNGGKFIELMRSFGGYPPLIYLFGGAWVYVLGNGLDQITFINSLFLVAGIIGVYKLSGNKILPAVIFSLFPVIYDISRSMLLDLPLTVFIIWGLYFWIKDNDWGILIMLILASLTKLNGFIYFMPIGLWYLWEARKSEKIFIRLVIGGLIYMAAVGWWWVVNYQNIYQYLTGLAGTGEKLTDPMNLMDWLTWIHYFKLFFLHQVGPILAILAVLSWYKIPKNEDNKKLIYWAIFVYVIFTIIKNKDFRFTMPLLPVVALWLGEWISSLRGVERRGNLGAEASGLKIASLSLAMTYLVVFYLLFNFVENSFGWPIQKPIQLVTPTFVMGDIDWINFSDYPVRAASKVEWPNQKLVKDMILGNGGNKSTVLVLVDSAEINDNNLKLFRDMVTNKGDMVLEMHSIYTPNFNEWKNFSTVLVGEKEVEPAPFYATNLEYLKIARDYVWDNPEKFQRIDEYVLPNKQKLYLFNVLVQ